MLSVVRPDLFTVLDFISLNHCEFGIIKIFLSTIVCFNDYTKSFCQPYLKSFRSLLRMKDYTYMVINDGRLHKGEITYSISPRVRGAA